MHTKSDRKDTSLCRASTSCLSDRLRGAALMIALLLASATMQAAEESPTSRVHALVNFEFSDQYLTPRGMIVQNDGLTFQPLVLAFANLYKGDSFINDFTFVGGFWNDFASSPVSKSPPFGSKPKTSWVEIDPIAGASVTFAKNFTASVTYTAFNMQILDIGTSQHLETKLAFDDSSYLKAFAVHPYFLYWQELDGKATAARVPYFVNPLGKANPGSAPGSSYYFEFGFAPSYTFKDINVKLEAPCRVLLPNKDFYGEYYHSASTIGLYELGAKASVPLPFMPKGYGNWSFHLGFRYMNFVDENLQDMQQFNAPGKSVDDVIQYYAGLTLFF